jgi:hypothetical protein
MKNSKQKMIFKVPLFIAFIIGVTNTAFSQTKVATQSSGFLILVETTGDGIKLTGQQGCAWKELTFTLKQNNAQAIDEFGMTTSSKSKPTDDKDLAKFLFIIKKTKEGINLQGKEGTAWLNLNFSCPDGKCSQYIDFNGMTTKD